MAERLNAPVLKTGWPARVTWVRILPAPFEIQRTTLFRVVFGPNALEDSPSNPALPVEFYAELRRLAATHLRAERSNHTLQATALINEVYLKLARRIAAGDIPRADFLAAAAQAMRQILVDYARMRKRLKRGNASSRTDIDPDLLLLPQSDQEDLPAGFEELDGALDELAKVDAEAARIVSLRFFAGLSVDDAASMMGISPRSAARLWQFARAWLFTALTRKT